MRDVVILHWDVAILLFVVKVVDLVGIRLHGPLVVDHLLLRHQDAERLLHRPVELQVHCVDAVAVLEALVHHVDLALQKNAESIVELHRRIVTVELRRSEVRSRVLVIVKRRSIASDHAVDPTNVARSVSPNSFKIYKLFSRQPFS